MRKAQPPLSGASFRVPKRAASQSIQVGIGGVFIVGETDSSRGDLEAKWRAGLRAAWRRLRDVRRRSYAAVLSNAVVLSRLLGHGKLKTITAHAQPAG